MLKIDIPRNQGLLQILMISPGLSASTGVIIIPYYGKNREMLMPGLPDLTSQEQLIFEVGFQFVADSHRADAGGRTREDQVAGIQREIPG